jgi:hypothetical protein
MHKRRSIGVTVLGVLFLVLAVMDIRKLSEFSPLGTIGLRIGIALDLICGIGILFLLEWSRKLVIYSMLLCIIFALISYNYDIARLMKAVPSLLIVMAHFIIIFGLIFKVFIIYFFTRPGVKEQFNQ